MSWAELKHAPLMHGLHGHGGVIVHLVVERLARAYGLRERSSMGP